MDDNGNGNKPLVQDQPSPTKQAPPVSVLVINFAAPGAAEFYLQHTNVSPIQMLAAAAYLDWYARRSFDKVACEQEQKVQPGIAVPGVVLPRNLKSN